MDVSVWNKLDWLIDWLIGQVILIVTYRPYLAPLLRYSDLLANNRKFFLPRTHLAPSFGVNPFEFMKKLYGSWN